MELCVVFNPRLLERIDEEKKASWLQDGPLSADR